VPAIAPAVPVVAPAVPVSPAVPVVLPAVPVVLPAVPVVLPAVPVVEPAVPVVPMVRRGGLLVQATAAAATKQDIAISVFFIETSLSIRSKNILGRSREMRSQTRRNSATKPQSPAPLQKNRPPDFRGFGFANV
jgi:hypothetical protein